MLEKFLEEYVDHLYENSNLGMTHEQQNLYTKSAYYQLLRPVVDLLQKKKDLTLPELREKLYEASGIEEEVKKFIYEREIAPGLVFTYGTNKYRETIVVGNRQEVELDENNHFIPNVRNMTSDTIFDLASVTKLYTSLSIFKLLSLGLLNLEDEVVKYVPEFKNLKGVTIFDLLTFRVPLQTEGRIDKANSYEEAMMILQNIKVGQISSTKNPYTDMGAMVLKYVIERAAGMDYYDFISKSILKPLQMQDTHVVIPNYKLDRTASTNGEIRYYKDGNVFINKDSYPGMVNDPKARILGQADGNLPGHAGLFSTSDDMAKLARGMIDGVVIDEAYLREMAKNRTGRSYQKEGQIKYVQYLGSLCYSKNPILKDSELFHAMSGRSIASAGWTGTQLTVDPINELYFFMAGNRSHNRLVFIDEERKNEVITLENNKKIVKLPNGMEAISATRFAWERDPVVVHASLSLAIQYKMLEDFYKLTNEKIDYQENRKTI